jgi:hypothetical protein
MLSFTRYLNPWAYRRQLREQRLAALRSRDGDDCRRCRRPIRFELPMGHDHGAKIERVVPAGRETLDNLCLTHGRCNAKSGDNTLEVRERLRPQREAELFTKARKRRRKAA